MKDKTATECWIILKDEIEGIIETFVPIQNQGKRSRKKHLSKEDCLQTNNVENIEKHWKYRRL